MFVVAPLTGSGFLCLKLGLFAPAVVALFHLAYGAILGGDLRQAARHRRGAGASRPSRAPLIDLNWSGATAYLPSGR